MVIFAGGEGGGYSTCFVPSGPGQCPDFLQSRTSPQPLAKVSANMSKYSILDPKSK